MSAIPAGDVEKLRRIRTFNQVFKYLVDERCWPLDAEKLDDDDLEALTYDWDPQELNIPVEALDSLERLRQMRPVTANQPWGVFFLEFSGTRLPITTVRRILRALVTKKRSADGRRRPSWDLADLLFIVMTGPAGTVELHFIAFEGDSPATAEFRPLTWRPDSPPGHLRRLAEDLLPWLDWPDDDRDVESWRAGWRQAFKLPAGQAIRDAVRLAERMASTASDLRIQIAEALDAEAGEGPFSTLLGEVRTQLVSDIDSARFADMCAQTLTYGVLSSRVTDPEGFGSSPVFSSVPLANPFLEAFFEQIHDQAVALDIPGSGLPQLVADLRATNVEAILDQFGATAKGGDPVIHFYEEFLKRYDAKMRADAGAFYTPQPVVEFMVRMVDEVLRTRFGLPLGIADAATWAEVAGRNGFAVPEGVDPDKPFVSMIDPATGTGTFLVEWLHRAQASFGDGADATGAQGSPATSPISARAEDSPATAPATSTAPPALAPGSRRAGSAEASLGSDWPNHLRDHVLPSMHAFENMLAPYAIAHLKVALEFHSADASDAPAQILLTDTLDHRATQQQFAAMADPIAAEGERAAELKESERFTVVIGNPPYDREQRDVGDTGRRKGGVVRYGAPGVAPRGLGRSPGVSTTRAPRRGAPLPALLDDITEPMRAAGVGHHLKNVYNDYVYFWRWAVWQATELPPAPGVVAFITASSYLDGVSMGGVRALLRVAFDELWIVDLGGEGRGAQTEENVFDIRTPVAVAICVRKGTGPADAPHDARIGRDEAATRESDRSTASDPPDSPAAAAGSAAGAQTAGAATGAEGGTSNTDAGHAASDNARGEGTVGDCTVRYLRISGSRADKLAWLGGIGLDDVSEEVAGAGLDGLTPRSDTEYYDWPQVTDLFPWHWSGCQVKRTWPIGETRAILDRRWRQLVTAIPRDRSRLLRETGGKTIHQTPEALLATGVRLDSLNDADRADRPEGVERYGYRSFDRQWLICDSRLVDAPKRDLWQIRGSPQIFLTSLTSTKLGQGPALTVTPYVPDLDHFRGSYGAKNVMPLYRDRSGRAPNIAEGLLAAVGDRLSAEVSPEDLLAYVHALAGTAAFTERFEDELSEAAGPIHLPITADPDLLRRAVELGRDLLWWHTWGERFAPPGQTRLPPGRAQQTTPVEGMPEKYGYDPDTETLTVGTGTFGPVSAEVWNFEVSGLKVVNSWLGYRMKTRKGRKSSPLDDIRPTRWRETDELLRLLAILEHTIEVTAGAAALLDEILANPLIPAADLPQPTPDQRRPAG
ncbi:MAG: N-6 DNA methylase [bacterium]|nr:N-6 DNA methylase [bacterium]